MPCSSAADIQADARGVRAPPHPPTRHAHVLAQAGGALPRKSPKRGREKRARISVRAPGRPQRSCSLQQVRRTRARSLLLSRHLLRPGDPKARAAELPAGSGFLGSPSFSHSSHRRRLFRGKAGAPGAQHHHGGSSRALWGSSPRVSTAGADSSRDPLPFRPGSAPGPPRIVSPSPAQACSSSASAPRQWTAPASPKQSRGAGASAFHGGGCLHRLRR